jgi:hypothetical protein
MNKFENGLLFLVIAAKFSGNIESVQKILLGIGKKGQMSEIESIENYKMFFKLI